MRNIFQDIHFDEDGGAELTQLIANDFFVAPSDSPNAAQYLWQKFIFTLRQEGQITLVEDQTGEIMHVAGRCRDFNRIRSDPVTTPVKISFEEIIMRLPFLTDEVNFWIMAMRTLQFETVSELVGQMLLNGENRKKYGITDDEAATLKSVLFRRKGKGTLEQWLRILWRIRELE